MLSLALFVGFRDGSAALESMDGQGGRYFLDDESGECLWFPASVTLTEIFARTEGRSGMVGTRPEILKHILERKKDETATHSRSA